jgi:hypothetical protein
MITAKITIKPHLREYVIGKYSDFDVKKPVRFPEQSDIYVIVWDLLQKRPANVFFDSGNLEIELAKRDVGKNPLYYNYISLKGEKMIERKIETMMWAEFHDYVESESQMKGIPYIESIHSFITKYGITSLSEDAMVKNYYRWRNKVRKKEKRPYFRKKIRP